jgi:hypothetical protein
MAFLVRMSHPMSKNGIFPFNLISTSHFPIFENEIVSKISLFLKQAIESWWQFQFIPPEKTEQILQQILSANHYGSSPHLSDSEGLG